MVEYTIENIFRLAIKFMDKGGAFNEAYFVECKRAACLCE